MNKLVMTLLSTAVLAGCVSATGNSPSQGAAPSDRYYGWLHPKLGMVKVDRATNAIVVPQREKERSAAPQAATPSR